jgi:hypothetical protein
MDVPASLDLRLLNRFLIHSPLPACMALCRYEREVRLCEPDRADVVENARDLRPARIVWL